MEGLDNLCKAIYNRFIDDELDSVLTKFIPDTICKRYDLHTNLGGKNKTLYNKENEVVGKIELCNYVVLINHDKDYLLGDKSIFKYYILHAGDHNTVYVLKINKKYL